MENLLTKSEARLLQTIDLEGSFLYELASVAQLTPTDVLDAAERLDERGYIALDRDMRYARITNDGLAVKQDISQSSLSDPHLSAKRPYMIMPDETVDTGYEEMSENDIAEAIDAELEKYG